MAVLNAQNVLDDLAGKGHNLTPEKQAYRATSLAGHQVELLHPTSRGLDGIPMRVLVQADQIEHYIAKGFTVPVELGPPVSEEGQELIAEGLQDLAEAEADMADVQDKINAAKAKIAAGKSMAVEDGGEPPAIEAGGELVDNRFLQAPDKEQWDADTAADANTPPTP